MTRQLMIGLPESGKTTFLAALWALLNAPSAQTVLSLDRYSGDRTRLEELAEKWLAGEEMGRTEQQMETWVELFLRRDEADVVRLSLPDLSGESMEGQWTHRRCGTEYRDAAVEADGILLFIHAKRIHAPRNLSQMNGELRALAGMATSDADASPAIAPDRQASSSAGETAMPSRPDHVVHEGLRRSESHATPGEAVVPYDPKLAPTQVKLVDLLQILCQPMMAPRRRRLAIVLSAWDLICPMGWKPARYLREAMPLLDQYLAANADAFEAHVYGVSCQGMDREEAGFTSSVGRLPEERILVEDDGDLHYDLTKLLRWAAGDG